MYRGLPASFLLHAGIIGAGYIALPYTARPIEVIEIVPVDIVNISEVTNIRDIRPDPAAIEPEIEEPAPEPDVEEFLEDLDTLPEEVAPEVEEAPPPPVEETAPPPPPEDIVPEEELVEPEEEEPEPEPEPEPTPEPEPVTPKRDALDDLLLDNSAFEQPDLLDLEQDEETAAPPPVEPEELAQEPVQASTQRQRGAGERTANEARVEALLWAKMKVCWGTVADLPDPERLGVTVLVKLDSDGKLKSDVELVRPRRVPIGDRFMGQAVDRALRAARKCEPYRLPAEDYAVWREITINFRHGG